MQSVADWEGADEMHTAASETNASVVYLSLHLRSPPVH